MPVDAVLPHPCRVAVRRRSTHELVSGVLCPIGKGAGCGCERDATQACGRGTDKKDLEGEQATKH
ncbi:MAG: hypothetical protein QOE64_2544 [Frankiales bacterium]|nr:hypothetical protein [Frankiales bacterium]